MSLRLPLQYLSIMCLSASETDKSRRNVVKQMLAANINRRREYLRQNSVANSWCYFVYSRTHTFYSLNLSFIIDHVTGYNTFGSVGLSVGALLFEPFDLDFWHEGRP